MLGTTNKAVCESIKAIVKAKPLQEVIKELSKEFVYMEAAITNIYMAFVLNENLILHGPAGFGKTEIVIAFCKLYGIPYYVRLGHEDMGTEQLLGLIDMKELTDNSTYKTNFESSIFAKAGILICEEFLDARSEAISAMKDVLTSKGLREGDTLYESLISSVVICTNTDPDKYDTRPSVVALTRDRFSYRYKVEWPDYSYSAYEKFVKLRCPDAKEPEIVSEICAITSKSHAIVSPRTCLAAVANANEFGTEGLIQLPSLKTVELDVLQAKKARILLEDGIRRTLYNTATYLADIESKIHPKSKFDLVKLHNKLEKLKSRFLIYNVPSKFSDNYQSIHERISTALASLAVIASEKLLESEVKEINNLFSTDG